MSLTELDAAAALIVVDLQKGIAGLPTVHPFRDIVGVRPNSCIACCSPRKHPGARAPSLLMMVCFTFSQIRCDTKAVGRSLGMKQVLGDWRINLGLHPRIGLSRRYAICAEREA